MALAVVIMMMINCNIIMVMDNDNHFAGESGWSSNIVQNNGLGFCTLFKIQMARKVGCEIFVLSPQIEKYSSVILWIDPLQVIDV